MSYSVELACDATGDPSRAFGGYLLFVRWSAGDPAPAGHLETDFLTFGATESEALERLGAMPLRDVHERLEALIGAGGSGASRPWWEAMRDEGDEH